MAEEGGTVKIPLTYSCSCHLVHEGATCISQLQLVIAVHALHDSSQWSMLICACSRDQHRLSEW